MTFESLLNNLVLGIVSGVIASIVVLLADRYWNNKKIKKSLKIIEGVYEHFDENRNLIPSCNSKFIYVKDGKFIIKTSTGYGNWIGEVRFDKDILSTGAGTFKYENKDEAGFINLQMFNNNKNVIEIAVYPFTLTHYSQKRNFYILRKTN